MEHSKVALGVACGICVGAIFGHHVRRFVGQNNTNAEQKKTIPTKDVTGNNNEQEAQQPVENKETVQNKETVDFDDGTSDAKGPRRLRKAESVLARRTSRLILVIERSYDEMNQVAILRTTEALGIQNVWIVLPACKKRENKNKKIGLQRDSYMKVSRTATQWLTMRTFTTPGKCIEALREENYAIWTTELSQDAVCLDHPDSVRPLPERVALIVGREADGVSKEMQEAATKRFYLPIHGWADSFNLAAATAMVLQKILGYCPEIVGAMDDSERSALREKWYAQLAKTATQRKEYDSWLKCPPPPYSDLRRPDQHRNDQWIKKKIIRRQTAAQERLELEAANSSS